MTPSVRIKVQGREYVLRTSQSQEQIQRVVDFVEVKLAETAAGISADTRDLTVLTLLNLAGQYLQLIDDQARQREQESRLESLADRIENLIGQ